MGNKKFKPSTLLAIFRRKGGEGAMTKIISDDNKSDFLHQVSFLREGEQPLVCFKQDELNWLLITSDRIIEMGQGVSLFIPYSELVEVRIALHEEFKDSVMSKTDFTRLLLKDNSGRNYVIESEKGEPYKGIYQMLHFIA
ncbi:hypothetical protein SAMN05660461_5834 [Chitinophaga ginsengisegetis]|uniref:PH domain-containing protein n=1 Tax=Chitinophaga ginsengisegetis TaxID=393003 RepID=A0A1T5PB86_9BACT|nr:hypothetical protein [Chitinophaga ginsengisegetis]SKD09936.1 hypothetical protein SAMN05660461_5834 [Chitinophaga ginsengisegetis]